MKNLKDNCSDETLTKVYLCIVQTENRILTIVSKKKVLTKKEESIIENQHGKIIYIHDNITSQIGYLI